MAQPTPDKRQAARLLQALQQADELTCEQAHDLLPALVDAELAGEDVDAAPEYAALLRHLDQCLACATLYAGMADDLAALADTAVPLSPELPPAPAFFAPARQNENVVLRVLGGLSRHFELVLRTPSLAAGPATLGSGPNITLFTDTLPEVEGNPLVSVSLMVDGQTAELRVAIGEAGATARWQVQVTTDASVQTATTDELGIARFSDLPITSLWQVTLNASQE